MFFIIYSLFHLIFFQVNGINYEGYKVLKVIPKSQNEVNVLGKLTDEFELDTWTSSRIPGLDWVMSVKPVQVNHFKDILNETQIEYIETDSNLRHTIQQEKFVNSLNKTKDALIQNVRRIRSAQRYQITMDRFYSYDAIVSYMEHMRDQFPSKISTTTLCTTVQGYRLKGIKITNGDGRNKPMILIEGGIHAREWISPAMALYLIKQLIENDNYKYMTDRVDWFIVPVLNPDGYEYTWTKDRLWRKNLSPGKKCDGVDLNRNWNFHWGESKESRNECKTDYFGPQAFSEIETKSFASFAYSHRNSIKLYLSFHSFGNYILYPWAYTSKPSKNENIFYALGNQVANAIAKVKGTKYTVGSVSKVLYKAPGCSLDWMLEVAGIPLSFTLELPGLGNGFIFPANKIKGVVEETFEGMKVFHDYVARNWG